MKTYTYRTIIEPDEKEYHGFIPLLKGVHTIGKTIEETKENLDEAIRCHLKGLLKDNIVPPDGRRVTIAYHPNQEIRRGTLKAIIDDLEMTVEEFIKALRK